ncbi:hypothetical protein CASFOL_037876 [Castilleja foliolosa]|uniref:MADS-box domain-containing protein n=1 Tax=Castilleja foliolosa TaxID=1961234 RepID=A0ABD3BJF8_9LAMI
MGRAKLNMELIADKKSRNTTFNNRKEGLFKKIYELKTLCDVNACMIIYGPKQETGFTQPEIWPPSIDEVRGFITDVYKPTANKDSGSNKTVGLRDFYNGRKRKIEVDLARLRKKNMEAKYPTRPEVMNIMTEVDLRGLAASLRNKSDYVKSRIEFMKRNNKESSMNLMNNNGLVQYYPTIDPHQDLHNSANQMFFMNVQLGAGPGFYEMMSQGPKPLARYYDTSLPVQGAVPYMHMMPAVAVPPQWPELQWTKLENDGGDVQGQDNVVTHYNQYQMNHERIRYYNE